jgi:competence protein ComEA
MDLVRFTAPLPLALAFLALACPLAPAATTSVPPTQPAPQTSPAADPVDINTASLDRLMKVPGMTRTWAARIIRFRPYRGKNELLDRGIVSGEVYARIKDHIVAHRLKN